MLARLSQKLTPRPGAAAAALLSCGLATLSGFSGTALAISVPLDELASGGSQIPDAPIELGVSPPPIVLLMLDDSLSMSSNMDIPDTDNARQAQFADLRYPWTFPLPVDAPDAGAYANAEQHRLAVPDQRLIDDWNDAGADYVGNGDGQAQLDPAYAGAWRAYNSDYNALYYDPSVSYDVWTTGQDANGLTFGAADPTAARRDPFDPTSTVDLTARLEYQTTAQDIDGTPVTVSHRRYCDGGVLFGLCLGTIVDRRARIAHYYTWADTNANGLVDASDTHVRQDITDNAELQNFANWFQYHRSRELLAKRALADFVSVIGDAYVGTASVNDQAASEFEPALLNDNPASGNRREVLDRIFATRGNAAGTPLRTALDNAGVLFECAGATTLYGNTNCPRLAAAGDGQCQRAATILVTDGFDTRPGNTVVATAQNGGAGSNIAIANTGAALNADGDNDTAFDGGAYADGFTDTLGDAAMHYYERDLDPGLTGRQFVETYVLDLGFRGGMDLPANTADPATWPDPNQDSESARLDDILHATFNGRGNRCAHDDPAIADKLGGSLALTAGSGQGTTSLGVSSGAILRDQNIFLATFDRDALTGNLEAFELELDGTLGDRVWSAADLLDLAVSGSGHEDRLVLSWNQGARAGMPFTFDYLDSLEYRRDQIPIPDDGPVGPFLDTLVEQANLVNDVRRDLDGTVLQPVADILQSEILDPILDATGIEDLTGDIDLNDLLGLDRGLTEDVVNYVRGERDLEQQNGGSLRDRERVLGPIYHSRPVVVGAPNFDYDDGFVSGQNYSEFRLAFANRRPMVYVGANDGLLHGFDADTGQEVFAYAPAILFGKLEALTDPGYQPQTYVDGRLSVVDAFDDFPACGGSECWRTILVGGLRGGGQGYFALDITEPERFQTGLSELEQLQLAADVVLWEFTDSAGGLFVNSRFLLENLLTDGLDDVFADLFDPAFLESLVNDTVVAAACDALGVLPLVCTLAGDLGGLVTAVGGPLLGALAPLTGLQDTAAGLPVYPAIETVVTETLDVLIPTDTVVGSPEMGFSFGQPNIVRLQDGRWSAVFGNGYHSTDVDLQLDDQTDPDILNLGVSVTGNAVIFAIDLATGTFRPNLGGGMNGDFFDTKVGTFISPQDALNSGDTPLDIDLPDPGSVNLISDFGIPGARPNGMSDAAPVDLDGDNIIDRIYAGDERGNVWRVDVTEADAGDWDFAFSNGSSPAPLFNASTAANAFQAITTRVEATPHPSVPDTYLILFGSGKFHETEDLNPDFQDLQTFYGIWDRYEGGGTAGPNLDQDDLQEQTIDEQQTVSLDLDGDGSQEQVTLRVTSDEPIEYDGSVGDQGWYLNMALDGTGGDGERIIGDPRLRNGQIAFATVIPGESSCTFEGESWFYRLDAGSGSRTFVSPFDVDINGQFPSAIKSEAISELPTVLLTESGQEVNLSRNAAGAITTYQTAPGGFERRRATWRELR